MDRLIELVRNCQQATQSADHHRAAAELYLVIRNPLRKKIARLCPPSLVDDVFQETLTAVLIKVAVKFRGDEESQFWGWCFRIARNKAADALRRKRKLDYLPPDELEKIKPVLEAAMEAPQDDPNPELDLVLEQAMQHLKRIKPKCFEFLWRRFFENQDLETMAKDYGYEYDAMRMRINRCVDSLRLLFESNQERYA